MDDKQIIVNGLNGQKLTKRICRTWVQCSKDGLIEYILDVDVTLKQPTKNEDIGKRLGIVVAYFKETV
jgi:hypothetical protein